MRVEGHGQALLDLYGPIRDVLLDEFKLPDGNVSAFVGGEGGWEPAPAKAANCMLDVTGRQGENHSAAPTKGS